MNRAVTAEDPDDSLPEIDPVDVVKWVAGQVAQGRRLMQNQLNQYNDEPVGFDREKFENVKRALALSSTLAEVLKSVWGVAPGQPTNEWIDDQFFGIMQDLYPDRKITA